MNRRTKQCISLGNFIFLLAGINQNLAETQEREKKKKTTGKRYLVLVKKRIVLPVKEGGFGSCWRLSREFSETSKIFWRWWRWFLFFFSARRKNTAASSQSRSPPNLGHRFYLNFLPSLHAHRLRSATAAHIARAPSGSGLHSPYLGPSFIYLDFGPTISFYGP